MILTKCAVCATELGLTLGKKCGRCSTRYCGPECQKQHWESGGHDNLCKKIKKAGGAEQYNANQKCTTAVAVAVEAFAEDTKDQTCYICLQAVHRHTGEGLVRGCACHTTEGFVHVSCLAEQAKILVAEAEENNLDYKVKNVRWKQWRTCSLCKQHYHGVVHCALGWACWKTYVGRPETDEVRHLAICRVGNGLYESGHFEDALSVREADLSMMRRIGASEEDQLIVQGNLANTYQKLGRLEEALCMRRDVYSTALKLYGEEHKETLIDSHNYANNLICLERFGEVKQLLHKLLPVARRVLGDHDIITLSMRKVYARAICCGAFCDPSVTLDDVCEGVSTLEDAGRIARRVLGEAHPATVDIEHHITCARAAEEMLRAAPPDHWWHTAGGPRRPAATQFTAPSWGKRSTVIFTMQKV